MLLQQTMEKLAALRLTGMLNALRQQLDLPKDKRAQGDELLAVLVDAEWVWRENRKLDTRIRNAKLKQPACLEDVDYGDARGLSKQQVRELATSGWVAAHQNVILTGPTGVGKSYLACALGNKACRDGHTVLYRRASRLFDELTQSRADGTYANLLRRLAGVQVLILDDFGLEVLGANQRRDLLEVMEDRFSISSTIVTSQLEPKDWHAVIGDATIADSICDRLVHNAHRLRLGGESIRKKAAPRS